MTHLGKLGMLFLLYCLGCTERSEINYYHFGADTNEWQFNGNAVWSFDGGVLTGKLDSGAGFVSSKKMFGDFELTIEFKPDSTINSGIFVRCMGKELSYEDCFEINIWDLHPNQEYRTGAIVGRESPLAFVETLNQWNTYRVICQDGHIQAWVNGIKTADLRSDELVKGYILLQAAGKGEIHFRNMKVVELTGL